MHPVSYDIDYVVERNRLTTFFRLFLAIPWLIFAFFYGLAALFAVLAAWFAMMFTGRYPQGLYAFVSGYIRFGGRLSGWVMLAVDEFPPLGGAPSAEYPVRVDVAPPQAEYSRAKTFFKPVLALPLFLLSYGLNLVSQAAAFITWWRVLFTGRQSATMHDALKVTLAYSVRINFYLMLVTETYPRILDLEPTAYPADTPGLNPAE